MKKQALTVIEIETFALSTSAVLDELRRPVSEDAGAYSSAPETRRRSALRWLIDSWALAGAGMAGVYVCDLLDPSHVPGNQEKQNHDEPRPKNIDASRRTAARAGVDTGR